MSDNNWWAQKLAGPKAPALPPRPVQPAVPVNTPIPQPGYPAMPQQPGYPAVPQAPAVSSKTTYNRGNNSGMCPQCHSDNYMKVATLAPTPTSPGGPVMKCYDCGFPLVQMESNTPSAQPTPGQVVHASRQISTADNYHPEIIVDKVPY